LESNARQAYSSSGCRRKPGLDAPHHAAREGNDEQGASDHPVRALSVEALRSIGELGFQVVQGDQATAFPGLSPAKASGYLTSLACPVPVRTRILDASSPRVKDFRKYFVLWSVYASSLSNFSGQTIRPRFA
jgi:hypothetical protein